MSYIGKKLKDWSLNWPGWLNIVLLFIVLEIAVLSIERTRWIYPQPSLTLVLFLSLLSTFLLSKSRVQKTLAHIIIILIGAAVSFWQATSSVMPGSSTIYFALFLSVLTWSIGYISTWFILRRHNAWMAVLLGAVVILVNLSNLPETNYVLFGLY